MAQGQKMRVPFPSLLHLEHQEHPALPSQRRQLEVTAPKLSHELLRVRSSHFPSTAAGAAHQECGTIWVKWRSQEESWCPSKQLGVGTARAGEEAGGFLFVRNLHQWEGPSWATKLYRAQRK